VAAGGSRPRRVSPPAAAAPLRSAASGPDGDGQRRASGRERHAQKITVYLSAEELLDLERARLALVRHGAVADRGRIVREAIAVLFADLDARGKDSQVARRIVGANMANPSRTSPNRAISNSARPDSGGPDMASRNVTAGNSANGNTITGNA